MWANAGRYESGPLYSAFYKGCADRGIPEVEPERSFSVSPSGIEIRMEALVRECSCDFFERRLRIGKRIDICPASRHALSRKPRTRLCLSVCARGIAHQVPVKLCMWVLSLPTSRGLPGRAVGHQGGSGLPFFWPGPPGGP